MIKSRAGVGYSENTNSFLAGKEAATAALKQLGSSNPGLILIFQTSKHSPEFFRDGVKAVFPGPARIVGGYAAGTMAAGRVGYDGFQSSVAAISFGSTQMEVFLERDLRGRGEREVGAGLARQIRKARGSSNDFGLIYLYDMIKRNSEDGSFEFNVGTYLLDGMQSELGTWPTAAGVGMIGNMQLNPTRQFFDGEILDQTAIALAFSGPGFKLHTLVMHGCRPASDYLKVTKAEGNAILEIDGKPALDRVAELMGHDSPLPLDQYPLFLTFGANLGDKYAEFSEENYASRLCIAIDKVKKSIIMFEPDLVAGTEIQIMRREVDLEAVKKRASSFFESFGGAQPFFAFYIDCAGRAAAYAGSSEEEGVVVQEVVERHCPMLGMYTGVELAAIGRLPQQALDFTGVLCVWTEN